jgi:hypothetical protein
MARDYFRNSFRDQSPPYRWARLSFLSSFLSFLEGQVPCKAIQIRLGKVLGMASYSAILGSG